MTQVERSLLEVNFPDFVTRFKDVCLDQLLPIIDQTIDEIRQADNSTLIVLLIILFVQLLRLALLQHRSYKRETVVPQQRQLGKEIKDLKKQFKSIQNMLVQLKQIKPATKQENGSMNKQAIKQIINSCRSSLSKRETISDSILDWQTKIIQEVTKLKKKRAAASRLSSKISAKSKPITSNSAIKSINSQVSITKPAFRSEITLQEKINDISQLSHVKQAVKEQIQVQEEDKTVQIPVVNVTIPQTQVIKNQETMKHHIKQQHQLPQQKIQVTNNMSEACNQDLIQQPPQTKLRQITTPVVMKPPPRSKIGLPKTDVRRQPPPPSIRRP